MPVVLRRFLSLSVGFLALEASDCLEREIESGSSFDDAPLRSLQLICGVVHVKVATERTGTRGAPCPGIDALQCMSAPHDQYTTMTVVHWTQ